MPTASFRFHLTMDTLAVQLYISHYLGMFRTFTCESAPMARKRKDPPGNPEGLFMMTESLFSKESIQLLLSLIDNSLQTSCIQFINDGRNSCLRINRTC